MKKLAQKKFAPLLIAPLILAGCSAAETENTAISLQNCGRTVTLEAPPERVVLQGPTSVPTLQRLGVLDRVVAKAGDYPEEYFDDETNAALEKIPSLTSRQDATGHLELSKEAIMAEEPDLIIGQSETVNPETTIETALVQEPGFCGEVKNASFDDVYDHIDLYGTLFAKEEEAQKIKDEVAADLEKIGSDVGKGKTVAVLYPGIEGASTYAYGKDSMSNPIVEAMGLENVFGDVDDRVFEISAEQLVAKNPDVILLLHSGQDGVKEAVTSLAGADTVTAVKEDKMLPMLLAFAEPPSPLAIDGVEQLKKFLSDN